MGSQPIIGYNYGAGNIARVKKTYLTATGICSVVMIAGMLVLEIFTVPVIKMFGSESALYTEFAVKCVRIFMSMLLFNGVQSSIVVFFQAIGKPLRSLLLSSLRQIVLLLPSVLLLPLIFEDSLLGLMCSSPVADSASFIVAIVFFAAQWKKLDKEIKIKA